MWRKWISTGKVVVETFGIAPKSINRDRFIGQYFVRRLQNQSSRNEVASRERRVLILTKGVGHGGTNHEKTHFI